MIVGLDAPEIVSWIKEGRVFIYPTDTVYGLGCNALDKEAVKRLRRVKGTDKPWSVIAPGKRWIREHCACGKELEELPGPFTFLYRCDIALACVSGDVVGVRLPAHPFTLLVEKAGVPFVTTSVNKTGEEPVCSLATLPREIFEGVDVIVDVGPLWGKPSTVIDYSVSPPRILRC